MTVSFGSPMIAHQVGLQLGELAEAQAGGTLPAPWEDWTASAIRRIDGLVPLVANAEWTSRASRRRPAAYLYARDYTLLPSECESVVRARTARDNYFAGGRDPATGEPIDCRDADQFLNREPSHPAGPSNAILWSRCTGEIDRHNRESRAASSSYSGRDCDRWVIKARSLASARSDVIEQTMRSLHDASTVLRNRLLPLGSPAWLPGKLPTWNAPAPTLEFLLLAAAFALSTAPNRQALTCALNLIEVEQVEPLSNDWTVALDLAMLRGVTGAERLAMLTASQPGDPLWGALAWAWRIRGMRRATMAELLIAFGLLDVDGRQAFEFAAPAEPTDDPKHLAIFAVDPERSVPEVRSFYR